MARIQSNYSGRKMKAERINPKEIRAAAEQCLVSKGKPSLRWGPLKVGRVGKGNAATHTPGANEKPLK